MGQVRATESDERQGGVVILADKDPLCWKILSCPLKMYIIIPQRIPH